MKEKIEVMYFDERDLNKNKRKRSKWIITFIVLDIFAFMFLFFSYGPVSYFRNLLVTTAMTTMHHKYLARILYNNDIINDILNNNYVKEVTENTDSSKIVFEEVNQSDEYESVYEEQILKKDEGNDLYKYIEVEGTTYKGYMVVIYDPSRISLISSKKSWGQHLVDITKDNNAILGINASGFSSGGGRNTPNGKVIQNGKLTSNRSNSKTSGLIGFNYDNVLILTKESAQSAIKNGMKDAMEFGPFLIVNGKNSKITGNGGWGIANRTAIAQRKDGIVLFLVIDGRSKTSLGATMSDLIEIFNKYKAYNAANLDGGGSSTLVINNELINNPKGYSYAGERYLPNAWILK